MTTTPNSPAELLLQQLQLEGQQEKEQVNPFQGLNPEELAEALTSKEFGLKPSEMLVLIQELSQRLLNFHMHVSAKLLEDNEGSLPTNQLFWLVDMTKLDTVVTLLKEVNNH